MRFTSTSRYTGGSTNPRMADMDAWNVTLSFEDDDGEVSTMTLPFYTGYAVGEPSTSDILNSLVMDAVIFENNTLAENYADLDEEDFASLEAQLEREVESFQDLVGMDAYEKLVWEIDSEDLESFCK